MWIAVCVLAALAAGGEGEFPAVERLIAAGRFRSALAALEGIPAPASATARWHVLASKAYDGLDDPARAVDEAQKAIDLDSRSEPARLQLAR